MSKILINKYFILKDQFSTFGDVFLLFHNENEIIQFPTGMNVCMFTVDTLNSLEYEPIDETIIPGSNHFALLWFYTSHPKYNYYWNIEYDVEYTGKWADFFEYFQNIKADFLSTHIEKYAENIEGLWWNTYQSITMDIPLENRIRSFNPIYRISENALLVLHQTLKEGNIGHHEVLIPSVLYHSNFKILDFDGKGEFSLPENKERFYLSTATLIDGTDGGTMRLKPEFDKISSYQLQDKLFHPARNNIQHAALKVLVVIVTY